MTLRVDSEPRTDRPRSASAIAPRRSVVRAVLSGSANMLLPFTGLALVVAFWQFAISVLGVPRYQLPAPLAVLEALFDNQSSLIHHGLHTASAVVLGLGIAIILGVAIGAVLAASRILSGIFMPLFVVAQSLPKIAIAPLLLVWLGLGFKNEVALASSMAIFPVLINTAVGLSSVPVELRSLARSAGANPIRSFLMINIRYAMFSIMAGIKVAATLAIAGAIVGEFVASNDGLGYYLLVKSASGQMAVVFADLVALSALTLAIYLALDLCDVLLLKKG
jgi:NitT/TauT family transport system permease protein